ncbi:substrate-binding periplasmic protein [Kiloniella majae]|uniref:substrate-binding periplasmic protein n=1 Tax=Kiloniella majae TaxID=1938558 RepID=UPI000A2778F2|nr:transporter substrate-binding domain-containing protein [Kiloniella majae]
MRSLVFTVLLALSLSAPTYVAVAQEPLQLVTLDYPPYEYKEDGKVKGVAVRIVREIFRRLDRKIEIQVLPWARSLKMVDVGRADAIFTVYRTPERELFLDYSQEMLIPQEVSLFVRKSFPLANNTKLEDLINYRFGTRRGVSYGDKFDQAVESKRIKSVYRATEGDALIKMLLSRRVDIIPFNRLGGYYRFQRLGVVNDVVELSPPIQSVPSYIAFSKKRKHKSLRDQVDEVLREMRADGTYAAMTTYQLIQ